MKRLEKYPESYQKAGEHYAHAYLKSFTNVRGKDYAYFISKPLESRKSCGRISPYLSWGNISIKQAFQHIKFHSNYIKNKRSYNAILSRLKWHCHFIQKFEMECDYETRCINRGYEQISYENRNELLEAWKKRTNRLSTGRCFYAMFETNWLDKFSNARYVGFCTLPPF